jgi:integrase
MNERSLSLWERRAEAHITLAKALDLFEAAYCAGNFSPRTVLWYRQRLELYFEYPRGSLGREPVLADLSIASFRLFALEKRATPRYRERELQPLTPDEELRLLEAYSETKPRECRNKAIFLLMLSTGIRKGG